jgi:hypothetical protein
MRSRRWMKRTVTIPRWLRPMQNKRGSFWLFVYRDDSERIEKSASRFDEADSMLG